MTMKHSPPVLYPLPLECHPGCCLSWFACKQFNIFGDKSKQFMLKVCQQITSEIENSAAVFDQVTP